MVLRVGDPSGTCWGLLQEEREGHVDSGHREAPVILPQQTKAAPGQTGCPAPSSLCRDGHPRYPLPGKGQWPLTSEVRAAVVPLLPPPPALIHRVPKVPGQPPPDGSRQLCSTKLLPGPVLSAQPDRSSLSTRKSGRPVSSSWSSTFPGPSSFLSPPSGSSGVFSVQLQPPSLGPRGPRKPSEARPWWWWGVVERQHVYRKAQWVRMT